MLLFLLRPLRLHPAFLFRTYFLNEGCILFHLLSLCMPFSLSPQAKSFSPFFLEFFML